MTCQHLCSNFPGEQYAFWARTANELYGTDITADDIKNNLEIRVIVNRDVYIKATVNRADTETDYAILTLPMSLPGHTPLMLRDSSTLEVVEEVYALGAKYTLAPGL